MKPERPFQIKKKNDIFINGNSFLSGIVYVYKAKYDFLLLIFLCSLEQLT